MLSFLTFRCISLLLLIILLTSCQQFRNNVVCVDHSWYGVAVYRDIDTLVVITKNKTSYYHKADGCLVYAKEQ